MGNHTGIAFPVGAFGRVSCMCFRSKILNILPKSILIHFCLHTCNTLSQLLYVSNLLHFHCYDMWIKSMLDEFLYCNHFFFTFRSSCCWDCLSCTVHFKGCSSKYYLSRWRFSFANHWMDEAEWFDWKWYFCQQCQFQSKLPSWFVPVDCAEYFNCRLRLLYLQSFELRVRYCKSFPWSCV